MTRSPNNLLALVRQGYSHRTIAEITGVTPEALQALIESSTNESVCPPRQFERIFERKVRFGASPNG